MRRVSLFWPALLVMCLAVLFGVPARAEASDATEKSCAPLVVSTSVARADHGQAPNPSSMTLAQARPITGWAPVQLPDNWSKRWRGYEGTVWYRMDWEWAGKCLTGRAPLSLGLSGLSMAGAVYLNDELLWRDESLVEPMSRSFHMPRAWVLPTAALRAGVNTVWVRVEGLPTMSPGLGKMWLGDSQEVATQTEQTITRQRTAYAVSGAMTAAVGSLFLVVWVRNRKERAYFWFTAMSFGWTAYVCSMLTTTPWPFPDSLFMSRAAIATLVLAELSACMFTWRFGDQSFPRVERAMWTAATVVVASLLLAPREWVGLLSSAAMLAATVALTLNCLQFQWHAWRTREPQHMLLAGCWLIFMVVAAHDVALLIRGWGAENTWSSSVGPVITIVMALIMGGRLVSNVQRIERYNQELAEGVAVAREELARALHREHVQALEHAKLQERVQIAHDLHDGLGGSLVRSMALVEQTAQPLPGDRVLSLLKVLRDDLRQVIDQGSSSGAVVPETPQRWLAPLRHRFKRLFDDMQIKSTWEVPPQWVAVPTAVQCLGLTRLVEEALSNVIKHSQATQLAFSCGQHPLTGELVVAIEDNGVGFDVQAVRQAGLSVGMRSMAARAERLGSTLQVGSWPGKTVVSVTVVVAG